jgi:hypothetical protein
VSAVVEACVLPAVFLTVILIGALRPGVAAPLVPPTPAALLAAVVLLALLVRSGAVVPERLMHASRGALANTNGLIVLVTLFVASAEIVTLLVPDNGVPALIGWTVLTSLLAQALVIGPDRVRLLRGLLVTFGAAFVLKFILLAAISSPAESRVGRALQILFEGATLGTISQRPPHPLDAYLAFATIGLYLFGVAWLPAAEWHMVRVERLVQRLDAPDATPRIAGPENES